VAKHNDNTANTPRIEDFEITLISPPAEQPMPSVRILKPDDMGPEKRSSHSLALAL
jgi:hypothetical protein